MTIAALGSKKIQCPYCGLEQIVTMRMDAWLGGDSANLQRCGSSVLADASRACGRYFVTKWRATIDLSVHQVAGL